MSSHLRPHPAINSARLITVLQLPVCPTQGPQKNPLFKGQVVSQRFSDLPRHLLSHRMALQVQHLPFICKSKSRLHLISFLLTLLPLAQRPPSCSPHSSQNTPHPWAFVPAVPSAPNAFPPDVSAACFLLPHLGFYPNATSEMTPGSPLHPLQPLAPFTFLQNTITLAKSLIICLPTVSLSRLGPQPPGSCILCVCGLAPHISEE